MSQNNALQCQYTIDKLKELVKKVCHFKQISQYHFRLGPKKYTQHQFVALLILYARSGKSLRDFIASLYESRWPVWLKLREIPCKSSLHNHFQRIGMKIVRALNLVVTKTTKAINYAIDSTGIDASYASKHYEKRIGRTHRPYIKLSVVATTKAPHIIDDFAITTKHCNDAKHAKPLIHRFRHRNKIIFADRAYDAESLRQIARQKNNQLYAPVRDFKVSKPKGKYRREMDLAFDEEIYHERNNVETVMFLLKSKGLVIRARKRINKLKELAWKILAYNMQRLSESLQRFYFRISLDNAQNTK